MGLLAKMKEEATDSMMSRLPDDGTTRWENR